MSTDTEQEEEESDEVEESSDHAEQQERSDEADGVEEAEEALTDEEIVSLFESTLENEGITAETVNRNGDVLEVVYNATGMTSEAVRTEIEIVADVYVRAVNAGLTTNRLEAVVLDPEGGSILDSFVIETEWAEAYSNEGIEWNEYIERIVETFESDS